MWKRKGLNSEYVCSVGGGGWLFFFLIILFQLCLEAQRTWERMEGGKEGKMP